jgi:hypothetical protein
VVELAELPCTVKELVEFGWLLPMVTLHCVQVERVPAYDHGEANAELEAAIAVLLEKPIWALTEKAWFEAATAVLEA